VVWWNRIFFLARAQFPVASQVFFTRLHSWQSDMMAFGSCLRLTHLGSSMISVTHQCFPAIGFPEAELPSAISRRVRGILTWSVSAPG
jgi:hypothetical protein